MGSSVAIWAQGDTHWVQVFCLCCFSIYVESKGCFLSLQVNLVVYLCPPSVNVLHKICELSETRSTRTSLRDSQNTKYKKCGRGHGADLQMSRDSAITFKNAKLTVNLGAGLFKALPFACSAFADIAIEDHGALVSRGQWRVNRVVVHQLGFLMEECSTSWTVSWRKSRLRRIE